MASYRPYAPPPPPPPNPNPNHHPPYPPNPNFYHHHQQPPPPPHPHRSHHRQPPPPPPPSSYYPSQPPPPPPDLPPPPPPSPPPPANLPTKVPAQQQKRSETEEERKARKKREYEKQKAEERRQLLLKQSQAHVLQRTKAVAGSAGKLGPTSGGHGTHHNHLHVSSSSRQQHHGVVGGKVVPERRSTGGLLSVDRIENNRLKKPTTFLCKLKFRNELPDPTAQPKLLSINTDKDRYTKYAITSLEKNYKPKFFPEPDLGIPLDLLDLSIYNPPAVCPPLDPEDEELLRDTEVATPVKHDGIRIKERPTDKGVSWLVKTQYISPLSMDSAKMSLTEKQAKELREAKEGRNVSLENLNSRVKQIQAIEESFKATKLPPVHQSKRSLKPVEILPLLPDLDRWDDRFVVVGFDGDPTADFEAYNKLDKSIREEHESQAIMKSFVVNGSDPSKPEKFLAYMAPAPDELTKDIYDESEDVSYSWLREYHWDVRGDDVDDPTTYSVNFGDNDARYLPLPTKLILQKKKAKEGRTGDEIEHYPVPSKITVRKRSLVAVHEHKEFGTSSSNHEKGGYSRGYESNPRSKIPRVDSMEQLSGEEDMSD